jgi:hypothetical protein
MTQDRLIIANCSGFYGDRLAAAAEMVRGGPIDILTGDYLAELTLAILYRSQQKNPKAGYASTFLRQMEEVLGECVEKGIKVVSNAGGLAPAQLAEELSDLAARLGVTPKIAYIDGDNLLPELTALQSQGEAFVNMDTGRPLREASGKVVTANVYLGGWGIAAALAEGADIVITPRVTDASLVVGPSAWKFGWQRSEWDKLAGAVVAGHIIECGPQACGGNYSFYDEVPSFRNIGFPLAEMHADGSCLITKHPGTGGLVSVGTVTAQLLYEIRGVRYWNPDVTARFDSLRLEQMGPDRVLVSGARGEPPPLTSKVAMNLVDGYRNSMSIYIAAPQVEKKAHILKAQLEESLGGKGNYAHYETELLRLDRDDPQQNREAVSELIVTVADQDPNKVGRAFSSTIVELALSTVPGFKLASLPAEATPNLTYWPTLVSDGHVKQVVHVAGKEIAIDPPSGAETAGEVKGSEGKPASVLQETMVRVPFGALYGTRSGDKGGSANLGVWARSDAAYEFLDGFLTVEKLKELLPDVAPFDVERHDFMYLKAMNFFIIGFLGEGAISSTKFDPQAKTLGEYLRSKLVDFPERLVTFQRVS